MTTDKLRIGVLGIGLYATFAHVPQVRATGLAEVTAICRRSADKLAISQAQLDVAKAYTDWREMLAQESLDGVIISTPHHLHAEQTIAALDRGLHVLVEKPMALTRQDAQAMIDAADRCERILMVGYNRRFGGLWRSAKAALAENAIGTLRQINLQFATHRRWYWEEQQIPPDVLTMLKGAVNWTDDFFADIERGTDWHADPASSGGGMFSNSGPHFVDLILWLADAAPVEVVAFSESLGLPVECILNIQARLSNGVLVSISSADVPTAGFGGKGALTLIGDQGILHHDFTKPNELWLKQDGKSDKLESTIDDTSPAAAFVEAITQGVPLLCAARDGIHAVTFVESVYRSAAEGRIVRIDVT